MLAHWHAAMASQRKVGKIGPTETVAEKPAVPLGEMAGSTAPETGTPVRSKTATKHPSTKPGKTTGAIALDDVRLGIRSTKRDREGMAPYDALTSGGLIVVEHETLRALGSTLGFTLGLRSDVAEKAIASGNVANYLRKRLTYHLGRAGLPTTYWFTIESVTRTIERDGDLCLDRTLHLHGAMLGTGEHAKAVRDAMRRAAGEWEPLERWRQAHTSVDPDLGWATYAGKELTKAWVTKHYGTGAGMWSLPFVGKAHTATRDLQQLAKSRYEELRKASIAISKPTINDHEVKGSVRTDYISDLVDKKSKSPQTHSKPDLPGGGMTTDAPGHTFGSGTLRSLRRASRPATVRHAGWLRRDPLWLSSRLWALRDDPRRRAYRLRRATPACLRHRRARPP